MKPGSEYMEGINYPEYLSKETNHKKIEQLLKGNDAIEFQDSQYVTGEPVDPGIVLSKVVYPACVLNPHVKEEVEQVLYEMLSGTDYDVYVVTLYVMSELFKEKHGIAPFKMELGSILSQLRKELHARKESMQSGIQIPKYGTKYSAWEQLLRYDEVCQREYGITLL